MKQEVLYNQPVHGQISTKLHISDKSLDLDKSVRQSQSAFTL